MNSNIPLVRIKYGWLLAGVTAEALSEKYGNGERLGTYDELSDIANKYEGWWRPFNGQVLNGLCKVLHLEFKQNIIDVYVSPWFTPISDPMVIGPGIESQDVFINTLSHELTHRLLTDNTSRNAEHDLLKDWKSLFGDTYDNKTLVHIPVHAVLKALYLDVIERPDLMELDILATRNNKPYADAWDYVQSHDHTDIVNALSVSRSS